MISHNIIDVILIFWQSITVNLLKWGNLLQQNITSESDIDMLHETSIIHTLNILREIFYVPIHDINCIIYKLYCQIESDCC